MKPMIFFILVVCLTLPLTAQAPVKRDLAAVLSTVPAPPALVKEAAAKALVTKEGELVCSAEQLFLPLEQLLKAIEKEYTSQPLPGAPAGGGDEKEMRKKMKSMSKEERMQMAMQMMGSNPGMTPAAEPPAVRAAMDECQNLQNTVQEEFRYGAAMQDEETALKSKREEQHAEIDRTMEKEIAKLPRISSGEMDAPDPAKVKKVKFAAAEKHIALADKHLAEIQKRFAAAMKHTKERYTTFCSALVKADYAAESKNFSTKKILSDAQMTFFKEIEHHTKWSRTVWEEAAGWQRRKALVEKE